MTWDDISIVRRGDYLPCFELLELGDLVVDCRLPFRTIWSTKRFAQSRLGFCCCQCPMNGAVLYIRGNCNSARCLLTFVQCAVITWWLTSASNARCCWRGKWCSTCWRCLGRCARLYRNLRVCLRNGMDDTLPISSTVTM